MNVKVSKHLIDCDAKPFLSEDFGVSDGVKIEEHQRGGQFKWDASKVTLWLSEEQQKGKWPEGNKLRKDLVGKPVMNEKVLSHLLAYSFLIPEEWKGKYIFFWGTIFRDRNDNLYVRYLYWRKGMWNSGERYLDFDWYSRYPAAMLQSD